MGLFACSLDTNSPRCSKSSITLAPISAIEDPQCSCIHIFGLGKPVPKKPIEYGYSRIHWPRVKPKQSLRGLCTKKSLESEDGINLVAIFETKMSRGRSSAKMLLCG